MTEKLQLAICQGCSQSILLAKSRNGRRCIMEYAVIIFFFGICMVAGWVDLTALNEDAIREEVEKKRRESLE